MATETVPFDLAGSAEFLEQRFGTNIEDLFNGVQAEIDRRAPGSVYANDHKPSLIHAMRQWFGEIHATQPADAYSHFAANIVQPEDTVVTFNYDVSLESSLRHSGKWCIGDGYGFSAAGLPTGSTVKVLKLHGSINWNAVVFGGRAGFFQFRPGETLGGRPAFAPTDLVALGHPGVSDPSYPARSAVLQTMIFPTSRKQFFFQTSLGREWSPFWRRLWRGARTAVRASRRVVICGYGMYPVDRRGCNLLLKGDLQGDVEVCCGTDSTRIVKHLREHGRRAHEAEQPFFKDWVFAQRQL